VREIFKEIWNEIERLDQGVSATRFATGEIIFSGLMGRLRCEPLAMPAAPQVDFCDPAPL
jgi:hypothetical protein